MKFDIVYTDDEARQHFTKTLKELKEPVVSSMRSGKNCPKKDNFLDIDIDEDYEEYYVYTWRQSLSDFHEEPETNLIGMLREIALELEQDCINAGNIRFICNCIEGRS